MFCQISQYLSTFFHLLFVLPVQQASLHCDIVHNTWFTQNYGVPSRIFQILSLEVSQAFNANLLVMKPNDPLNIKQIVSVII